jgi:hypothetical protein
MSLEARCERRPRGRGFAAVLVAAVATLAAACTVGVEGAKCLVPGAADGCPSGQSCGNDGRCSERAAGCADRCAPSETFTRCVGGGVARCTEADPACGAWVIQQDCAAEGLPSCQGTDGAAACGCAPATAELVVDASAGSTTDATPAPTGARTPASCRFRSLAAGLAAAGEGSAVVLAGGDPHPAEGLVVQAGVTLRGDVPASPGQHVIALAGPIAAGVVLAEGSTLSGLTVRQVSAPPGAAAVKIACGDGLPARVDGVVVEAGAPAGGTALATGLWIVEGSCPVELARVTVTGAATAGIDVARGSAAGTVLVEDSLLDGNAVGVRVASGDLTIRATTVQGSAMNGVAVVAPGGSSVRLAVEDATLRRNGDTALLLNASTARLHLLRTRVCENAAVTPRGEGTVSRIVGGIYLPGQPPADLVFAGNRLFENEGDQLLVVTSPSSWWHLDGAPPDASACDLATRNLFGGHPTGLVLFAGSAKVSAVWNGWAATDGIPAPSIDYQPSGAGATVDAGDVYDPPRLCPAPAASELVCDG